MKNRMIWAWTISMMIAGIISEPALAGRSVTAAWAVGQEREVDEGYYFKLLKVSSGWRLWQIETRDEIECRAVKSAIGLPHPVPIGASVNFGMGVPFIVIHRSNSGSVTHFWEGPNWRKSSVQFRRRGERFWSIETGDTDYADGDRLEVNITSWKYPEVRVGYDETRGLFDLTGLDAMRMDVARCYRSKKAG